MSITTTSTPGMNLNELFNSGMNALEQKGQDLQSEMTAMLESGEATPEKMLALQYEVGLYNSMMESLSSVTKSMTDLLKNLAQRTS